MGGLLEDFLFFLVNPHFGIKKFCKKEISWHKRWCLWNIIPVSYAWGLIIGTGLLILGGNKW